MSLINIYLFAFIGWCAVSWAIAVYVANKFFGEK